MRIIGGQRRGLKLADVGTSASGYNCTVEGTVTASRLFDFANIPPTGWYVQQFPLGVRPRLTTGGCLRIRCHFAATVDVNCWVIIEV